MENSEDTKVARRLRVENATFSWTPRAWCLQCGSIARRSRTGKVSSSCWNSREIASPSASLSVDGRRLYWRGQGRGLGGEDIGVDGTDRAPSAEAASRRSDEGMGEIVGQRGGSDRMEEAVAAQGL
jgi:hypothetical protein